MKRLQAFGRMLMMAMMSLICAVVPAMECYAAETQAAVSAAGENESIFFFLIMGGGLLIILFAVVVAIATVSSAVSVAANMDVDGD